MSEELKVTDRRWWARGEEPVTAEEPKLKPTYIEELEARLAAKDSELQQLLSRYRGASDEFDQARARLRVSAREERDVVPSTNQLLGEKRDDAFCAAVEFRGNRLVQRRDLSDPHARSRSLQGGRHRLANRVHRGNDTARENRRC